MKEGFSDILHRAISGDSQAIAKILDIYRPLIDSNCFVNGDYDEDCRQYIELRLILDIQAFGRYLI